MESSFSLKCDEELEDSDNDSDYTISDYSSSSDSNIDEIDNIDVEEIMLNNELEDKFRDEIDGKLEELEIIDNIYNSDETNNSDDSDNSELEKLNEEILCNYDLNIIEDDIKFLDINKKRKTEDIDENIVKRHKNDSLASLEDKLIEREKLIDKKEILSLKENESEDNLEDEDIKKIIIEQSKTSLIINKGNFKKIVQEIGEDYSRNCIFSKDALEALHIATEDFMINIFEDCAVIANYSNKDKITTKMMILAKWKNNANHIF